ncbi:tail fiber protein [Chromobacterium haemolyticum]|uniref:Tail fiber protein n=2 Tax=Chromobacterium haemolyticum TaxID=394935 RepID=A0ABS3GI68_9NEIS|nr:tail fiber protein [Chromobacterium haemolyticum]MBK0413647.1 tail fiber protein [Chromobacterium haemolyticum]MBO0414749.1 tail fiber protein [Chromobacterium haemolyticum]MBO0498010.1 tail fiber protein [Chromobacterium haemolyticum]
MLIDRIAAGFAAVGRDIKAALALGQIGYFAAPARPCGWLLANGAELSRTRYSGLFQLLGTAFGDGDGSNTFNLPALPAPVGVWACIYIGGQVNPRTVTLYAFNPVTGEYQGSRPADVSPVDADEVVLRPPFTTDQAPPTGERQTPIMRNGQWVLVPDYRQVMLWSTQTGAHVSAQLGQSLATIGATDKPPPAFGVWNGQDWVIDQDARTAADAEAAKPEFRYLDDSTRRAALTQQAQQDARARLLAAYVARKPLEDAVKAGAATAYEQELLAAWKRYCNMLAKLSQQPGYPALIDWPQPPYDLRAELH